MARIAGVDLPREKRVDIGLTYIFGIGRASALQILKKSGVGGATRVKDLSEEEIVKLREVIERDHQVEGDLRKRKSLPVRGQRTRTNARTRKGKRAAIGKARKPAAPVAGA